MHMATKLLFAIRRLASSSSAWPAPPPQVMAVSVRHGGKPPQQSLQIVTAIIAPSRVGLRFAAARGLAPPRHKLRWAQALEVEYSGGTTYTFCAELLRVESPAANSGGLRTAAAAPGTRRVVAGRRHVTILNVEPVGNYAIRILFDDLHSTGIYSWGFLHELGRSKFARMRSYIHALRERRLSRSPARQ
eukprot:SM000085S23261  [mRNA]  locus=s85:328324:329242:- [translate_table: standard]